MLAQVGTLKVDKDHGLSTRISPCRFEGLKVTALTPDIFEARVIFEPSLLLLICVVYLTTLYPLYCSWYALSVCEFGRGCL